MSGQKAKSKSSHYNQPISEMDSSVKAKSFYNRKPRGVDHSTRNSEPDVENDENSFDQGHDEKSSDG